MSEENEAQDEPRQTYTKQDVINQSLVAFGQGTNFMRVSSLACREFVRLMLVTANEHDLHEDWGEIAVQLLERVRSIGRVTQAWAIEDGDTVIREANIRRAFRKVGLTSKTDKCGPGAREEGGG